MQVFMENPAGVQYPVDIQNSASCELALSEGYTIGVYPPEETTLALDRMRESLSDPECIRRAELLAREYEARQARQEDWTHRTSNTNIRHGAADDGIFG